MSMKNPRVSQYYSLVIKKDLLCLFLLVCFPQHFSSDYMTSTVGQVVNDEWKGFGRNWSWANCKTEENYKNKISIRIVNDMLKIQTKVYTE